MKLLSKYSVMVALRGFAFMFTCTLLSLFLGSGALSDNDWIGWSLFAGFLIIYFAIAFYDGSDRGARDAQITARNERLSAQGHVVDQDMLDRAYSLKKGMTIALLIAVPGLVLSLAGLVTLDGLTWLRAVTRVYFSPFLKLYFTQLAPIQYVLSYFLFSLTYPAVYLLGYATGPKQYAKQCETIRKNEEDYKKGIRRKRKAHKRRRGFFW